MIISLPRNKMIATIITISLIIVVIPNIAQTEDDENVFEPFTQAQMNVIVGNVQRPNGIVWYDDNLYTACNGDWTLYEIDSVTGETRTYIQGIRNAHMLVAEQTENERLNLWMPDYDQNAFLFVNQSGAPRIIASDLEGPWGIAPLEDEFLITNLLGNTLVNISRDGELTEILDNLRAPTGIAIDGEFVYVANNGSSRRSIEWFGVDEIDIEHPDSMSIELQPLVSGLQNTTGVVMAEDGYLYFTFALGTRGVVGRVDPVLCQENGGCTNDEIEIIVYTELPAPLAGLAISPDMRLFVHSIYRPEIYWVQLDAPLVEDEENVG